MNRADQRKYHYIYKITRLDKSGKYYIGMHSTDNVDDGYFGSGSLLSKSIKKHGKDKHKKDILEFLPTREALKLREKEIVNEELISDRQCMNIQPGGGGGGNCGHITDTQRRDGGRNGAAKLSNRLKNDKDFAKRFSHKMSEIAKNRFIAGGSKKFIESKGFLGKTHSPETLQKMKELKERHGIGESNSQYGTCWIHSLTEKRSLKIDKVDLDSWTKNSWIKGRKLKF